MYDDADPEMLDAVTFSGAPGQNVMVILFGILVLMLGILPLAVFDQAGRFGASFAAACGIFVGGWIVCRGLSSLRGGRGAMLSVGKSGICDRRISADLIPWSAVRKIDVSWAYKGASPEPPDIRALLLHLEPDFVSRLRCNAFSRFTRMLDKWIGVVGVRIGMFGVSAKPHQVVQALDRYFPRWRQDCEQK
jgi:hypothetical protein